MNANTRYLREKRAKAHADAVQFLKAGLTSENRAGYNRAMDEVESLGREIIVAESDGRYVPPMSNENAEKRASHAFAFDKYLRGGLESMSPEERKCLESRKESREQTAGEITLTQSTGTAGGYLVPAGFADEIDVATKFFAPLMDTGNARTLKTDSGSILPFPTSDDTGNEATLIGEGGTATEQAVTFGVQNFYSFKYTSGVVIVTNELMQDSAFDIYAFLSQRFAERYGRAFEAAFTNGLGKESSQPTGFMTAVKASGQTPVIAAGSNANDGLGGSGVNTVGSQDIVALEHSVDPTYRRGARYVFHDTTLGFLKGLLDKFGRPLWTPGLSSDAPDMINGYPYVIDQAMDKLGASNSPIAFGDFSKFIIRKVSVPSVRRLVELYALQDSVGFVSFQRVDSNLVDAGTHPLGWLMNHS
jgi:HK97 family phage major capsid protein